MSSESKSGPVLNKKAYSYVPTTSPNFVTLALMEKMKYIKLCKVTKNSGHNNSNSLPFSQSVGLNIWGGKAYYRNIFL